MTKKDLIDKIENSPLELSDIQSISKAVDYASIPINVREAIKYVRQCESDLGFMGSSEYDKQKAVILNYNLELEKIHADLRDRQEYERLRLKYESQ